MTRHTVFKILLVLAEIAAVAIMAWALVKLGAPQADPHWPPPSRVRQ